MQQAIYTAAQPVITKAGKVFEQYYITLRKKENRIYSDEELSLLPDISSSHPHFSEWVIRKRSARKLLTYLSAKRKELSILETGCGNGWLSHQLSEIRGSTLTATDINLTELEQAASVFGHKANLRFIYGDIRDDIFINKFDIIIFAASIQYFSSLREIINTALGHLKPSGEIHIIDSPFYKAKDIDKAKQRTIDYYMQLNMPEMADHYFHHSFRQLSAFRYSSLYDPGYLWNRWKNNNHPFPWIRIKTSAVT